MVVPPPEIYQQFWPGSGNDGCSSGGMNDCADGLSANSENCVPLCGEYCAGGNCCMYGDQVCNPGQQCNYSTCECEEPIQYGTFYQCQPSTWTGQCVQIQADVNNPPQDAYYTMTACEANCSSWENPNNCCVNPAICGPQTDQVCNPVSCQCEAAQDCQCTDWQVYGSNNGCGQGGCAPNQQYKVRTCTPHMCETHTNCMFNPAVCGGTPPGPGPGPHGEISRRRPGQTYRQGGRVKRRRR